MAASAIVSAEIVAGLSVSMAAANGREAALVLRKVRRLSIPAIIADQRLSLNTPVGLIRRRTFSPATFRCVAIA
jgi:hypothetical protein